jgi:hypothetical protein
MTAARHGRTQQETESVITVIVCTTVADPVADNPDTDVRFAVAIRNHRNNRQPDSCRR